MRKEIEVVLELGKNKNRNIKTAAKLGEEIGKTLKEEKSKNRNIKIATYILCLCWLVYSEYLVAKKEKAVEGADQKIAA